MPRGTNVALAMLALTVALSGCAGRSPFASFGMGSKSPKSDAPQMAGKSTYDGFTVTEPQSEAKGNVFSKSFNKVADAMTIKPKVVKADDPVSLSSQPKEIGPELYLSLARMHEHRGNFDTAINQYHKALEVAPQDLTTLVSLARLYDRQGQFERAEELYQRAVKAHPDSAVALNDLGLCYARQSKLSQSLAVLQQAVKIDPHKTMYRNNLASVLAETGRDQEAFEQLAAVNPPAVAHYNMGYLLYQRDQYDAAARHFARAVEADPSMTAAQEMLAKLAPANHHRGPASASVSDGHNAPQAVRGQVPAQYTGHSPSSAPVTVVQPNDRLPTRLPQPENSNFDYFAPSTPPTPSDYQPGNTSAPSSSRKINSAGHKYR